MIYQAQVIKLNDDIEEEVALQINGVRLNCFASVCPYPIEEGKSYSVQLELVMLDDYEVMESPDDAAPAFVETGKGFAYLVQGKLNGRYFEAGGLVFEDEVLQTEFGYLDGKMVTVKADRIDVEFLPQ
ncbi:MAG: hypothetical protein QM788_11390 [Roseateles sp.]|uniref:hypothetical protein n=1 Tax=Roseateles sp. TaxID=1971397 RepID=UPI0039EAC814